MFRVVIIEDEEPAARRLFKLIRDIEPNAELLASLESVSSAINWLKENPHPDLIFSDIQLADGISFDIFKVIEPGCPIVFVTAYDQYAIEAFKVNSIDYILKPVKKEELQAAIRKFRQQQPTQTVALDMRKLLEAYQPQAQGYKNRFVVRYGDHIKTIQTEEIAYCYTEDKVNFLTNHEGRRYAIDSNLDQLENQLPPQDFFRINRQYIISIRAISEMLAHTKGRVLVKLQPPARHETIVSTERSAAFKAWLDGQ